MTAYVNKSGPPGPPGPPGDINSTPTIDDPNPITPVGRNDAIRFYNRDGYYFANGRTDHAWVSGQTLHAHVDSYGCFNFGQNLLVAPITRSGFGSSVVDGIWDSQQMRFWARSYGATEMGDPADMAMRRVGPDAGFPYGKGAGDFTGTYTLLTGIGSGSDVGQFNCGATVVPFNGDLTTQGASVARDTTKMNGRTDEMHRVVTKSGQRALAMQMRILTTPPGTNTQNAIATFASNGHVQFGLGAVGVSDPGTFFVRGTGGMNEQHKINPSRSTSHATLISNGKQVVDGAQVLLNDQTYTFRTNPVVPNEVRIGIDVSESLDNLRRAVNGTFVAGDHCAAGTLAPTDVTSGQVNLINPVISFNSKTPGPSGNGYPCSTTSPDLSFGGSVFVGGTDITGGTWQLIYYGPIAASPKMGGVGVLQAGTVQLTNNSNLVVGVSGTHFTNLTGAGAWVRFGADSSIYQIKAIIDDANMTLGVPGSTSSGDTPYLGTTGPATYAQVGEISAVLPYNATVDQIQTAIEALPSVGAASIVGTVVSSTFSLGSTIIVCSGSTFTSSLRALDYVRKTGASPSNLQLVSSVDTDIQIRMSGDTTALYPPGSTIERVNVAVNGGPLLTASVLLNFCGLLRFTKVAITDTISAVTGGGAIVGSAGQEGWPSDENIPALVVRRNGQLSFSGGNWFEVQDVNEVVAFAVNKTGRVIGYESQLKPASQGPYTADTLLAVGSAPIVYVNTTGGPVKITLNTNEIAGAHYTFVDYAGTFSPTNKLTILQAGSRLIDGLNASLDVTTPNVEVELWQDAASAIGWRSKQHGRLPACSIRARAANSSGTPSVLSASADGQLLVRRAGALIFGTLASGDIPAVTESMISLSDVTTDDAATSRHGFLKKLDNVSTHYMDGTGAWSTPSDLVHYKNILRGSTRAQASVILAAGTYYATVQGAASGALTGLPGAVPLPFYLQPSDWAESGKTTKLRLLVGCLVTATAPGITFVFGLYPVTGWSGSGTNSDVTVGAVVAGSTVTYTTPAANSIAAEQSSGDFNIPVAGYYMLAFTASGAAVANSNPSFPYALQLRNV